MPDRAIGVDRLLTSLNEAIPATTPAEKLTYCDTRFACRCGRFLAATAVRSTPYRDDSKYYGISDRVEWDCSRCGTVEGEEWEPQIVVVAEHHIAPGVVADLLDALGVGPEVGMRPVGRAHLPTCSYIREGTFCTCVASPGIGDADA